MKEIVPKRDIWYTKSGAADCKQAVNDDERCQSFTLLIAGQSPMLMEYGQPLFVWLSRD